MKKYFTGKQILGGLSLIVVLAIIALIYAFNKNSLPDPYYSPDYFARLVKKGMPSDSELCVSGLLGLEAYIKNKSENFYVEPVSGAIGWIMLNNQSNEKSFKGIRPAFRSDYIGHCRTIGMSDHEVTIFKGIVTGETPKFPKKSLTECMGAYLLAADSLNGLPEDEQADVMLRSGEGYGAVLQLATKLFKGLEGVTLEGITKDALPLYVSVSKVGGLRSEQGKQAIRNCAYFGLNPMTE